VPRRINTLCDRLLLFGALEEKHEIGAEEVDLVTEEIAGEVGRAGFPVRPCRLARRSLRRRSR